MELRIIKAGLLTTVQDLGRPGRRSEGIPLGGAADPFALRLANLLVGNPEDAAGLEMTLSGGEVEFPEDMLVSVCGARFEGVPAWHPFVVRRGDVLRLGRCIEGCRGYLAVAGGIDVPRVLGGRGTCLQAGFGGHEGRKLRDGDTLPVARVERRIRGRWRLTPGILPAYSSEPTARVVRGLHAGEFPGWPSAGAFRIDSRSDRMGVRLRGNPVPRLALTELLSTAVAPGTIQVPPDGNPIVLLADAQTLGGYPQVAHVATVDLPLLAQLRPGMSVRFQEVDVDEAQLLLLKRERELGMLRQGLAACIENPAPEPVAEEVPARPEDLPTDPDAASSEEPSGLPADSNGAPSPVA